MYESHTAWREGDVVVLRRDRPLPPICLFTAGRHVGLGEPPRPRGAVLSLPHCAFAIPRIFAFSKPATARK